MGFRSEVERNGQGLNRLDFGLISLDQLAARPS